MDVVGPLFAGLDFLMREAALFAACGFLVLGLSDVAVDLVWLGRRAWRPFAPPPTVDEMLDPASAGFLAIFVPAWDEVSVIGDMLRRALSAWGDGDWRIYVGVYPNDPATATAVSAIADPRLRLVTGPSPGPTTKADCLNNLWLALLADEAAEDRRAKAIVLHDAEDVVHPAELRIFDSLSERFDLVQLPVVPLIDPDSRWIGGHYADEFAESHAKEMVVRQAIGAALPSAGVGCAFSRAGLDRIAEAAGGLPFDAASLTEDYELGLKIAAAGGTGAFVRFRSGPSGRPVATREYFPGTLGAAVAQKARWMTGIALAGWDRLGWSGGWAETWMRLRDRQSLLAAFLLFAGYLALALWLVVKALEGTTGIAPAPLPDGLSLLVAANMGLLTWRLALRAAFTASLYGWREGFRAVPRAAVSNLVAMLAAAHALARYRAMRRRGGSPSWVKTRHAFPAEVPAE
jgi:bacteriophage N4 adsorption protein B